MGIHHNNYCRHLIMLRQIYMHAARRIARLNLVKVRSRSLLEADFPCYRRHELAGKSLNINPSVK